MGGGGSMGRRQTTWRQRPPWLTRPADTTSQPSSVVGDTSASAMGVYVVWYFHSQLMIPRYGRVVRKS